MYAWSMASAQAVGGPVKYELHKEFMLQPPFDTDLSVDVSIYQPAASQTAGSWIAKRLFYATMIKIWKQSTPVSQITCSNLNERSWLCSLS